MQACLVILLAVMGVGSLSGIQLDLGRILQDLLGLNSQEKKILEDYPSCGELGEVEVNIRNDVNKLDNTCMQTCEWKKNPYFKQFFWWKLFKNDKQNQCIELDKRVKVLLTAPNIPKDLNCLKDCFKDVTFDFGCNSLEFNFKSCKTNRTIPVDYKIDCMIRLNIAQQKNLQFPSVSLAQEVQNVIVPIGSVGPDSTTSPEVLRATNSLQLALEICSLAKFLSIINFNPELFESKDCDDIIKDDQVDNSGFFDISKRRGKKGRKRNREKRTKNKIFGATTKKSKQNMHPWLCALKEVGFRGRYRCGVTLLSGPPDPILVSAAHCNYVCKDSLTMQLQDICCCRQASEESSCIEDSSYCAINAKLTKADPDDLQIVCGEQSLVEQPEAYSNEDEVVLMINDIVIHKDYSAGVRQGPYLGSDIAVYRVNSTNFYRKNGVTRLEPRKLYPACLPKETYDSSKRGIFAAWSDLEPTYRVDNQTSLEIYTLNYFYPRQVIMENIVCKDPAWMKSDTYYPPGTSCYQDPSFASCVQFGNSGSGIVRKFESKDGRQKYALAGVLSMSKGCDLAWIESNSISYASSNPSVFTDAYCYLDWIAEQYGMKMPDSYKKPDSCKHSKGNIADIDKTSCQASGHIGGQNSENSTCDFNQRDDARKPFDKCRLLAAEGFAYNLFQCKDANNQYVLCANNCIGVDPNAVIIGGSAVLFATAAGSVGFLIPAIFGFGGIALAGGSTVANEMCPIGWCNIRGRCCMIQLVRRRLRCPSRC